MTCWRCCQPMKISTAASTSAMILPTTFLITIAATTPTTPMPSRTQGAVLWMVFNPTSTPANLSVATTSPGPPEASRAPFVDISGSDSTRLRRGQLACRQRRLAGGRSFDDRPDGDVLVAQQRRGDDHVRGGDVVGHRNVPQRGQPQQRLDVRIVRLGLQRIPEEDQHVDLPLGDFGADLLVAAERAGQEPVHLEAKFVFQQRPGGAGRVELVLKQRADVVLGPAKQV